MRILKLKRVKKYLASFKVFVKEAKYIFKLIDAIKD